MCRQHIPANYRRTGPGHEFPVAQGFIPRECDDLPPRGSENRPVQPGLSPATVGEKPSGRIPLGLGAFGHRFDGQISIFPIYIISYRIGGIARLVSAIGTQRIAFAVEIVHRVAARPSTSGQFAVLIPDLVKVHLVDIESGITNSVIMIRIIGRSATFAPYIFVLILRERPGARVEPTQLVYSDFRTQRTPH